ncbi:MAG: GtrA family protein, partial [Bacteroidota bacterium]|nr:GtrA family protein [Bacteroidota bacterium]
MTLLSQFKNFIISIIDWFYTPFKKIIPPETFRYAATGGFNVVLDITLYFICFHYIIDKQIVEFGFFAISPHIA